MESALPPERPSTDGSGDPGQAGGADDTIERIDLVLRAVEQALVRLDEGTYGQCHRCASPIDDERLTIDPTIQECASCALGGEISPVEPSLTE
jgi:RNA polymerase-binding transcription factor DksA